MVRQSHRNSPRRLELAELAALDKDELTDIIDGVKKVSESLSTGDILSVAVVDIDD